MAFLMYIFQFKSLELFSLTNVVEETCQIPKSKLMHGLELKGAFNLEGDVFPLARMFTLVNQIL
jgi:hypothetical protein